MKTLRRLVLVLATVGVLVGTASPAWAVENLPEVSTDREWFYWLAPLLALSAVLLLAALALGYYVRVQRPKMRGR